jgi:hypothetical protein
VVGKEIAVKKYVVRLSAEERAQLDELIRKGKRSSIGSHGATRRSFGRPSEGTVRSAARVNVFSSAGGGHAARLAGGSISSIRRTTGMMGSDDE